MRLFLRHTWLVAILGTAIIVGTVAAGIYFWNEANQLRIAAGPLDLKLAQALADQIAKQDRQMHVAVVPTSGPAASVAAMNNNTADFALLPSNFEDPLHWPVISIVRQNVIALIIPAPVPAATPAAAAKGGEAAANAKPAKGAKGAKGAKATKADKGDKSGKAGKSSKAAKADDDSDDSDDSTSDSDKFGKVTQLAGKRVGIVGGNEANAALLELVLNHYGVPIDKVTLSEIDPKNLAGAIKNKQVDALFVAGAATGRAIASAVAAATQNGVAPTFIEIDQADGIAKRHPAFDSVDIDAGTFGGNPPTPDDDLKSLSFAEYVVARRAVHDSVAAMMAKVIYSSRQSLAGAMPGEVKIEAPSTDKDADIVLHPGALAYLSDSQQSFFDKYGDDIFYGMLIFPVFGSAIAAVAGYLMRSTRTRRLRLLQGALDIIRRAHIARDAAALDQLQVEADQLVVRIIHQSDHEEFDETARMSFSFALDQLRFAIAERRATLRLRAELPAPTGDSAATGPHHTASDTDPKPDTGAAAAA